jgi:hypothetical protein
MNKGGPVLLSEQVAPASSGPRPVPAAWTDDFSNPKLHLEWYQLRTQYTETYKIFNGRLVFRPNVFSLSERDTPAALLRKQKSLNMTFSAELLGFKGSLGPRNRVGISAYLSEFQHQDIGLRGCVNATGMCLYTETRRNGTLDVSSCCKLLGKDAKMIAVLANTAQHHRQARVGPHPAHQGNTADVPTWIQLQG